jgi:hypothetical protein
MKRLLPIFISFVCCFIVFFSSPLPIFAQSPTDSRWVIDPEVTFIGKNARRSGDFLDWTLQNYNWVCVKQISSGAGNVQCDNTNNPIEKYWSLIVLYIVVPMLFIVILATSIVIIVTRGKSLTIMRFIPRFIAVVLLIVFSYSLLQFFYQFTDLIQGFFLRSNINQACPPNCISDKDLLYVGWDYTNFVGLRLLGDKYAESAFISLLLTKLTALTYFVMVFLLLVRKIILWFFIIVSPIFPILLLYYPVRNTGKIWIGEFFRWLLYAPLFAIFLNGLVYLWRNQIPLVFTNPNIGNAAAIEYPTAVNILLGGPRQQVTPTNSVNLVETFALYVVSLIMLWIVILLPWILLQIFLDYAQNFAPGDTAVMKTLVNMASSPKGSGPSPAPSEGGGGVAINLPFAKKFSIPTSVQPGPTGAAKEIKVENATINAANFSRPALISTAEITSANVNASVLNTADIKLPSMRDIARFDIALTSNDVSKQSEVSRYSEQLVRIANPVVVTNTVEKDRYVEIREKIGQQNSKGNVAANNVLKAAQASTSSLSNVSNQKVKSMLAQMANPSLAQGADKEKMTQLNSMLKSASINTSKSTATSGKEKTTSASSSQISSQLASSILSVNEKTSDKEVQKIKDQLSKTSGSQVSKDVTSAISQSARNTSHLQETIKQVANPATITKSDDKVRVEKLRGTLERASKEGNSLAASILSVNEKTSVKDIEALQERIQQAQNKGEPVATELATVANATNITKMPMVNKVQSVKKEDYQAVKDMWKQNYQNLEVPQGMAGNRSEWIKDDIKGIDETLALLSSPDQDKQQQGMDQVSNLLPFLLVGGFSQSEIVDYLKAKQEAAKEVSTSLASDEEDKVGVTTRATHATQAMSAAVSEDSGQASSSEDENESPLSSVNNISNVSDTTTYTQPEISNEIVNMVNVKVPKLRDIAQFETRALSKDTSKTATMENMQNVLSKIADPAQITDTTEREKFEKIHEKLVQEQQQGNPTAGFVLNAAARSQGGSAESTKSVLAKIVNPALATQEADKKRFDALHESLTKASSEGNQLASAILSTNEKTSTEEIEKLQSRIQEAQQKGESIAATVSPVLATHVLPAVNKVQTVSSEEYEAVKNTWKQNYQNLEIPLGEAGNRSQWMQDDIKDIDETIGLLSSTDQQQVQQGMDRVSSVLPFLLAGGFSQTEIIAYLKAKQEAAKEVSTSLAAEEEDKVGVSVGTQQAQVQQTMATSASPDSSIPEEESSLSNQSFNAIPAQQVSVTNEFLTKANLVIPKMVDVAKYETRKVTTDNEEATRQEEAHEALLKIANPAKFVTETERQKFEDLRNKLAEANQKGDATAGMILSAATSTTDKDVAPSLPASNKTQAVSQKDYDEVRMLWEENYRTLPIPAEFGSDRSTWIKSDCKYIEETITLLTSADTEKQKEGMKRVSDIMPMLLLGGFSSEEVVGYLKAKLEAGKNVLSALEKEEESSVTVSGKTDEKQQEQAQEIDEKPEEK